MDVAMGGVMQDVEPDRAPKKLPHQKTLSNIDLRYLTTSADI
jgi:hypothetical protein